MRVMIAEQRRDIIRFLLALRRAPMAIVTDEQRIQMLGLETYVTPLVAQGTVLNRTNHRVSVLYEQERQDINNINEADTLRRVSEIYSIPDLPVRRSTSPCGTIFKH